MDSCEDSRLASSAILVRIYVLVDPRTNAIFYVGKTESPLQTRLRGHICDALAGRSSTGATIREIVAAGLRPTILCIDTVPLAEWVVAERKWITHYRSLGPLVNRAKGGEGVSGVLRTPEWTRKIVEARTRSGRAAEGAKRAAEKNRGRKQSAEERTKRSATMKGMRPSDATIAASVARCKGKPLSPERAAKCGTWRGKKQSACHSAKKRASMEQYRDQISKEQASRWRDPEYRERVTASMKGRKLSAEHILKMADVHRRAWADPQSRAKRVESLNRSNSDPKTRAKNSAAVKAKWADPAWRAARSLSAQIKRESTK